MSILDQDTCARLQGLASEVLFHGTRYMAAILRDDELALPIVGTRAVYLATNPQVAAYWANIAPRPFDEGRGGIIALDGARLRAKVVLEREEDLDYPQYQSELAFRPILDLQEFVVGRFWLDELAPGVGLEAPLKEREPPYPPAISLANVVRRVRELPSLAGELSDDEYDANYWDVIGQLEWWAGVGTAWDPIKARREVTGQ